MGSEWRTKMIGDFGNKQLLLFRMGIKSQQSHFLHVTSMRHLLHIHVNSFWSNDNYGSNEFLLQQAIVARHQNAKTPQFCCLSGSQVKAGPNDPNHTKVSPPCSSITSIISIGNRISEVKCFLNGVFPHEMTTPKFQCRSSLVISSYAHMRAKLDNMPPHKHQQHFMIIDM